ncbi:MAG: sulfatase-like hydrolase/transferase [Myxococcota bacterium]|nr:sulfatase-like hydrolase/transferase [Myxococcota bacterium]
MGRAVGWGLVLAAVGVLLVLGWVERQTASPRLVLVYATCSLQRGMLGPYAAGVEFTPALDRFADAGVVFARHRTEASMSGIAYASLLTGVQAPRHGVFTHPTALPESVYDVTEAFADGGYAAHYWSAHRMASPDLRYGQAVPAGHVRPRRLRAGDPDFAALLARLASERDARAFVLTAFSLTHAPYASDRVEPFCAAFPARCAVRGELGEARFRELVALYQRLDREEALRYGFPETAARHGLGSDDVEQLARVVALLYASKVHQLDEEFGALVDAVDEAGLADDALIVFTADHGETLYDERAPFKWSHAHTLRSDVLDVPLILRAPGLAAPRRYAGVTRSVDLLPTLAGLAGRLLPEGVALDGVDLAPALRGQVPPPDLVALSHTGMVPFDYLSDRSGDLGHVRLALYPRADMALTWVAARRGDRVWKLANAGGAEGFVFRSFDLAGDPAEARALASAEDPAEARMRVRLERYKAGLVSAERSRAEPAAQTLPADEALERLRALGYVQ